MHRNLHWAITPRIVAAGVFVPQGGVVNDVVLQLLELQEVDTRCSDLSSRIESLEAQKKQLRNKAVQKRSDVERSTKDLDELKHNSRIMNLEVDELDAQIRDYQRQLDTGIISFKEMEALRTKIVSQHKRMEEMEDEALLLMSQIEEGITEHAKEEKGLTEHEAEIEAGIGKLDEQVKEVQEQLLSWEEKRQELVSTVPAHALRQYEHLHIKFEDPVVALENGICEGCRLSVSGTTVERARDGMEIVTCENCSRIVYAR